MQYFSSLSLRHPPDALTGAGVHAHSNLRLAFWQEFDGEAENEPPADAVLRPPTMAPQPGIGHKLPLQVRCVVISLTYLHSPAKMRFYRY